MNTEIINKPSEMIKGETCNENSIKDKSTC